MDSTKTISFMTAWHHCATTASYWAWLGAFVLIAIIGGLTINYVGNKKNTDVSNVQKVWWIVFAFLIFGALLIRPGSVAANTTEAMAAANQWLGY